MTAKIKTARSGLTDWQRRKLRRLLADAVAHVPWYRREYGRLGLTPRELADPDVLRTLPILSKTALLDIPLCDRLNSRFDINRLTEESTTGSTGQPFSIYINNGYKIRRNLRFLRGLMSTGYRPWQSLMLLTDRHREPHRQHRNRHYCSVEQSTEAIAETYLRVRPAAVYGFTTPLRLLAEYLESHHPTAPRPERVIATAEMLASGTRDSLERAFRCPVFDFYGMTEMGLVAWQGLGADGYISAPSVITELVPVAEQDGRFRTIVTNLDLRTCPIVRFDSGDIAIVEKQDGKSKIIGFEGRFIDSIVCRDGAELSPYRVTDALRDIPGLKRFKVTQRDLLNFDVAIEIDTCMRGGAREQIEGIFARLLGTGLNLKFEFREKLIPEGTAKFRPVESLVTRC